MKFADLTIENFLTIGDAKLNLKDRGLLLVQGVNDNDTSATSNGAGKSSIADALCWCLYGVTARGESGDNVINNQVGKNTRVSIEIDDGPDNWRISRHRKHKPHKNTVRVEKLSMSGQWDDLTKGTDKLTQQVVNDIMGCSYEVFASSVYAGQEKMPCLPTMTDKALKVLVEEAAGVTLLEKAYEVARGELKTAKSTYEDLINKIDMADDRYQNAVETLTTTQQAAKYWENSHADELEAIKGDYNRLAKVYKAAKAKSDADDMAGTNAKIAEIDKKLSAVNEEQDKLDDLRKEETRANNWAQQQQTLLTVAKKEAQKLKARLEQISDRVGEPCSECGKPYCEADLDDATKLAKHKLTAKVAEIKTLKSQLESAQEDAQKRTDALQSFRASMTDTSEENAHRATYSQLLKEMNDRALETHNHLASAKRMKERYEEVKNTKNPFLPRVTADHKKVDDLKQEHDDLVKQRKDALEKVEIAELVAQVYSPAGVRAYVLDEVTPFLNSQTAKYLGALSDGNITATWNTLQKTAKGELKEKFSIEVANLNGGTSFGLMSGGERRKVRIASALALQDLVARRASKPISIFIGDEIDDALDPAGLERLMGVLDEKAKERGTVIVISHSDLKDWISQQVIVRKSGPGASTVSEITA